MRTSPPNIFRTCLIDSIVPINHDRENQVIAGSVFQLREKLPSFTAEAFLFSAFLSREPA